MANQQEVLNRFAAIKMWKSGGERAPHKPLLILYMLGRAYRQEPRLVSYSGVMEPLQKLLNDYGPPRQTTPAYPFFHLSSDGVWEIRGLPEFVGKAKSPSSRYLVDHQAQGGFTEEVYGMLQENPLLIKSIAGLLLNDNFPPSLHEDILQAVGLDVDVRVKVRRDSKFRERILVAYSFRCAVCDFSVWLGRVPVALEAAHIKWHQAGGPDEENNGLLLCTMHHKLFDRGVFSIDDSFRICVSDLAHGNEGFDQWLARYHGKSIRNPDRHQYRPKDDYLAWHVREVFRGISKYSTG